MQRLGNLSQFLPPKISQQAISANLFTGQNRRSRRRQRSNRQFVSKPHLLLHGK